MAEGLGFKTFITGEVLTAADVNGYLMQGVLVFASEAARDAAITSPQEGQFAFTKDTNSLWYYSGAAWVASGATGDIEGVTAGVGISGGGTSGTVTVTNSMATAIDAKADLVVGTGDDTFSVLTVGADDTVLTADSSEATGLKWAAAGGGGADWSLVNVGGTALTGAATVTVSGITGADKLFVIISGGSSASASSEICVRINTDTGSNYHRFGLFILANASYSAGIISKLGGSSNRILIGKMTTNAAAVVDGAITITGGNSSGVKVFSSVGNSAEVSGDDGQRAAVLQGYYNSASTISSVSAFSSSGNFDAGTIYVYKSA